MASEFMETEEEVKTATLYDLTLDLFLFFVQTSPPLCKTFRGKLDS